MDLDPKEIENLRKVYNEEHSDKIPAGTPEQIWSTLKKRLRDTCKSGRAECIMAHMLKRPAGPKSWNVNPEEWISANDIDDLEKRFEKIFAEYKFVGTFPIDFDKHQSTGECIVGTLCSMNIKSLYDKGFYKIGIIFNTDVNSGPGQHWIATFCDIRPDLEHPRMTYFDSYAQKPEPQIQVLMRRWKKQWDATGLQPPMKLTYNGTRDQYQDSECGVYCLYFHYCCLLGIPMNKRIPDEVVRGLRGLLFKIAK